ECITTAPTDPPIRAATKATGSNLFVMIIVLSLLNSNSDVFAALTTGVIQQHAFLDRLLSVKVPRFYDESLLHWLNFAKCKEFTIQTQHRDLRVNRVMGRDYPIWSR